MAVLAVFVALLFRLGSLHALDGRSLYAGAVIPFTGAASASFILLRTYRTSWRHASTADLITIVQAATLAVLIYLPMSFVTTRLTLIPRSFVLLSWLILIVFMAGGRVTYRLFREGRLFFSRRPMKAGQLPILIVGGGTSAELFLRGLDQAPEYYPVGVLDDRGGGALLRGVPILGKLSDAERVIESFGEAGDRPRKLVVVDRFLSSEALDRLVQVANERGLTVARGPDPTQLLPGAHQSMELHPISVEDLLGRSQIVLDPAPVRSLISGKRVLVTGAGGSIGSEIVRQVCSIGPAAIGLVDASEFNLYTIDNEVANRWPGVERMSRLIDVRHRASVQACFSAFRPDIVFHAAALKHVPLVEANPVEGIWTNVIGSRHVCDAAAAAECDALVLISTDKAVNPTNVMGASKRCAESYCQALALAHRDDPERTRFMAVRFGNVLGSAGSVVPLFEQQLKAGGPLTVTHPDIERFFMTIRESVQLVLQASALGVADPQMFGRVFVLDMGQPVKITELARQMIRLAGLQPDKDIAIQYVGLRPGEKLFEELFHEDEQWEPTVTPRISVASPRAAGLLVLASALSQIESACVDGRREDALEALKQVVTEYCQTESPRSQNQRFQYVK
jgi:O-antigen biosynthesis protein WbqV